MVSETTAEIHFGWKSGVAGAAALLAVSGVQAYRWQDWQDVPRCLPWQTVDDGCDRYNVPCPEGFKPGSLCYEGKLFYPGEIGITGWWHRAWFVRGAESHG